MDGGLIERIETGAGRGASALFAGAVGYAAYGALTAAGLETPIGLCAAGVGALAYLPCSRALGSTRRGAGFALPQFAFADFEFEHKADELLLTERVAPDELVLTESDRLDAPLVLDDVLELGPQSRVVRLFDRKLMPAPPPISVDGTLGSIPSDASQALSAALAELRRSLR